jgi:hypothetical protein
MGFNRRKMEDERRQLTEKEAAACRATDAQVLEDAERLIAAWNERQAKRMPMLFSPTITAWFPVRKCRGRSAGVLVPALGQNAEQIIGAVLHGGDEPRPIGGRRGAAPMPDVRRALPKWCGLLARAMSRERLTSFFCYNALTFWLFKF